MATSEKLGTKKNEHIQGKENFLTKIINFYNNNEKIIFGILIGILVVVGGLLAFNKFYLKPLNQKASALMVQPIKFFVQGDSASLNIALEGNDDIDGFLTIASDFKLTRTANTANLYAGLIYLKQGNKEEALDYLLKFKKKEDVLWYNAQAIIGDIYDEMEDTDKALKYYKKACESENNFYAPIALFKLGQLYERQEKWEDAYETYQMIEDNFYQQYINMGVDKCLERAKIYAEK